jgi:hypothetical protein
MEVRMRSLLVLALILAVASAGISQQPSNAVIIQTPTANATVGKTDEVAGLWSVKGAVPVVFVKGLADTVWYIQEKPTLTGARYSCANAHFGETTTEKGVRFKIVVLAVPTEKAKDFPEGKMVPALPADFPRSADIVVMR